MRYRTIVADPPWVYDGGFKTASHNRRTGRVWNEHRTDLPYDSMTVEAICALPVADLAGPDCFLFLWTTNRYLRSAFEVAEAWGFRYRQMLVWSKDKSHCLTTSIAPNHAEFLLVGKRGSPRRIGAFPSSVIEANRTKRHSAKPGVFLDHVEASCPGPYLELFARRARPGWDCWGDEAPNPIEWAA